MVIRLCNIIFILSVFIFMPCLVSAADTNLVKDLQKSLDESRSIIEKAKVKLRGYSSITSELSNLKSIAEEIRALHMLLQETFRSTEEQVKDTGTKAQERHWVMTEAYMKVISEYLGLIDNLPPDEEVSEIILDDIKTLLDKVLPRKKAHIYGNLPYRNLNYPSREPVYDPSIIPAYKGGSKTVSPDDLEGTLEAPISEKIAEHAESLDWNPVLIYEWVKNNIETEWYWGCMKGAEDTLRQGSGNDCDQATLLVALLRASGYPSRYVRGVIEFFPDIEIVKNITGIDDPQKIAVFFQKAGIPYNPIVAGGKIANFQIEHIWVESRIPFANFHGAVVDEHGKTWIGLDTSIKVTGYEYNDPIDILQEFSISSIRDEYLNDVRADTPLEYIKNKIEDYLLLSADGYQLSDVFLVKNLIPEEMQILPASMQFKQIAITHEYKELPDELIHKVRFTATTLNPQSATDNFFDITLETLKLSNQEITISYDPETVEDQEIINSFGGLDNTPAYLVRLRPVLKLNGENVVVGGNGLPIGEEYNLTVDLISPNGIEKVTNTHITGNYAVIGIVAQKAVSVQQSASEEGKDAARLLYEEAISYVERWNDAEEELASLMHLAITRPIPTVVTLGGVIDVTYLLDTPHDFEWKGVYVDADLRVIEAVAGYGLQVTGERIKTYMRLSSLQGSILENRILEDDFQVESISTAKLLGIAANTQPATLILTINKTNIDTILPTLFFADAILEDIRNAVNQGFTIRIPQSEIVYHNWTGVGYLKENPETGESGYMLSGMIAGGMTAGTWPVDLLSSLINPNSEQPNDDPSSAYHIFRIADTDFQKGIVGEKLPKPLQVMVLDDGGRPVKGADVTFTIRAGGGSMPAGMPVQTDARGIASIELFLGENTGDNPAFMNENSDDTFSQQVGENIVDASIETGAGIKKPFTAYGFPKEPAQIKKNTGDGLTRPILTFAGFVSVGIEDVYGNPVSNIPVDFNVLPAIELSPCSNPNNDTRPALFISRNDACWDFVNAPELGECGSENVYFQQETNSLGSAAAHIIMGATPNAEYQIQATYDNLSTTFTRYTEPFGSCDELNATPSNELRCTYVFPADIFGNSINGVKSGEEVAFSVRLYYLSEYETGGTECFGQCPKIIGQRQYDTITEFDSAEVFASGEKCTAVGEGIYQCKYIMSPGLNEIDISGTATITRYKFNNDCSSLPAQCGEPEEDIIQQNDSCKMFISGVDVTAELGPDDFILVDEYGFTVEDFTITHEIIPSTYQARIAYVVINKDGEPYQYINTAMKGKGIVTLFKGYYFDTESTYTAQVVLNMGSTHEGRSLEIRSEEIPLAILSTKVSADDVKFTTTVDRINGDICASPEYLRFELFSDAEVTIEIDGSVIMENVAFSAGPNQTLITRDMVPDPGEHDFKITAVFIKDDPRIENSVTGVIEHEVVINEFLPVGHTFVKNVDLQGGHLTLSREDIVIPGLGLPFNFSRSYGSVGNNSSGPMGAGWTHSYNSRLVIDGCGVITIIGGEGSGIRFSNPVSDQGELHYQPQAGYHGRLVSHADGSYDFTAKSGTQYHYEQEPSEPTEFNKYTLRYIEDPNGNRVTLHYDENSPYNLITVEGASGRTLNFDYSPFGKIPEDRITKISGPQGLEVLYNYDQYGNLIESRRGVKIETYEYTTTQLRDLHNLTRVTDPNGNATEYAYYTDQESISGYPQDYDWNSNILIFPEKHEYVKSAKEASGTPEEVTTSFEYDYVRSTRTVTNGRGYDVEHTLNSYGSVTEMKDPSGNITKTKWAMDTGINDIYVVEATDAEGNVTKYEYDENGNQTKVTDALGNVRESEFELTYNKPIKITDANNNATEYTYDGKGNLKEMKDPLNNTIFLTYYDNGNRKSTTNANGKITNFTYDTYGNISSMEDPEGGITSNTFDERSRLTQVVDANGHKTGYVYDELDRLIEEIDHLGHSTQLGLDNKGNKILETDANGHETRYEYDAMDRLVRGTDAHQMSALFDYDDNNNKIKETDKNGNETHYVYNELDRLVKQVNADGEEMSIGYDKVGNVITNKDYNGYTTNNDYDKLYRLVTVADRLGNVTSLEYDSVGNTTKSIDPNGHETVFVYDANNRLISMIDAMGHASIIEYDRVDNRIKETDLNSHSTVFSYDGNNRLIFTRDHLDYTVEYTYDGVGNTLTETNQNGHTTRYEYDPLNRRTREIDPHGFETLAKYDPAGLTVETQDARGNKALLEYDALNRLTRSKVKDPGSVNFIDNTYTYDANGNKLTEKDQRGFITTSAYDKLNRPITITDPLGQSLAYEYDGMGNITGEIDKRGIVSAFVYDEESRLTEEAKAGVTLGSYEYDPAGNKTQETDANGHTALYSYDELDRLVKVTEPLNTITSFTYDNKGNNLTETDAEGHITTFTYDELDRLVSEKDAELNITTHQYDGVGNRIKVVEPLGEAYITEFAYDKNNRLIKVIDAYGKTTEYTYDGNGNKLTEKNQRGYITALVYDYLNRLIKVTDPLGQSMVYEYDGMGNITGEIDKRGIVSAFVYDEENRLTEEAKAGVTLGSYEYDPAGNKTQATDANSHTALYSYDELDRLVRVTAPLNTITSYTYDNKGNKLTETDAEGHATTFTYDALDRLVSEKDAELNITTHQYDGVGNRIKVVEPNGEAYFTEFTYDKNNRLIKVIDAYSKTTEYTYDGNGNKLTEKNQRGFITALVYDYLNRPITITDPLGQSMAYEYDGTNNKTRGIDKRGIVTTFVYDAENRLTEETKAGVTLGSYEYDPAGNKTQVTNANGNTGFYSYDELGRLVRVTTPLNTITSYTYDNKGNKLTETNPEGHTTINTYDELNRLATVEDAAGNLRRFEYDKVGKPIQVTQPMGEDYFIRYEYDARNLLVKVVDALGQATEYTYDSNGNRLSQRDANGHLTTYEYDSRNRRTALIQHRSEENLVTRKGYDNNGNRTELIDPEGQTISFVYDALDRLSEKQYPQPRNILFPYIRTISYEYDANNNQLKVDELKVISEQGETVTEATIQSYDDLERLTSVTNRDGKVISYGYDQAGNRTSITDPDGNVTGYTYDDLNRFVSAQTEQGTTQCTYYPDGQKHEILYPNGTSAEYEYDLANRVTKIGNYGATSTLSLYQYTYDRNGNRLTTEETQEGVTEQSTFTYDLIDRLLRAEYPSYGTYPNGNHVSYTYDAVGNRLTEMATDADGQVHTDKSYTYNELNWLAAITDQIGSNNASYVYDNNGNTIRRERSGTTTNYSYDVKDYLRLVSDGTSELASFDYNYNGMRISKTGTAGEVRFVYDDQSVLLETDDAGNTIAKYDYGDQLLSMSHTEQGTQFYMFSALGSVSNLTNADGTLRCSYKYDAWGNFRKDCDASWNSRAFTGKEWDEETGLIYFGSRYYDPEIGRFTTQDTYLGHTNTPPSLHRYLYAYANPTRYVDPSGFGFFSTAWDFGSFMFKESGRNLGRGIVAVGKGGVAVVKGAGGVVKETGYQVLDIAGLGIDAASVAITGDTLLDYHVRSDLGQWVDKTGAGTLETLNERANPVYSGLVHGYEANEHRKRGDYEGMVKHGALAILSAVETVAIAVPFARAVTSASRQVSASTRTFANAVRTDGLGNAAKNVGRKLINAPKTVSKAVGRKIVNRAKSEIKSARAKGRKLINAPGALYKGARSVKQRLSYMARTEPGTVNWKRSGELKKAADDIHEIFPARQGFTGAKYRGTNKQGIRKGEKHGFSPKELNVSGIITKRGMRVRNAAHVTRNFVQNLTTRYKNLKSPKVVKDKYGRPTHVERDFDFFSDHPSLQRGAPDATALRYEAGRIGNEAAGVDLIDMIKPDHAVLPRGFPKVEVYNQPSLPGGPTHGGFLQTGLPPGVAQKTENLFGWGSHILDTGAKGRPWVGARQVIITHKK